MNDGRKQELIERHLDGALTAEEKQAFEAKRQRDPAFDQRVRSDEALAKIFEATGEFRFESDFATRVISRLDAPDRSTLDELMAMLWQYFPRVAAPASLLTAAIMTSNYRSAADGASIIEALLGLPGGGLVLGVGM